MSFFDKREAQDVIPSPTKALTASATLGNADSYVLVNGPASSGGGSPGFTTQTDSVDWDTSLGSFGAEAEYSANQVMGVYPDFTLAVWLKPTGSALTNRCWIFQNYRQGNSTDDIILEARGDVSGDPFSMYVGSGAAFPDKEYQFGQMELDTWTYIVATWDDSTQTLKVYQDGVEQTPNKIQDDTINPALTDTGNKRVNMGNNGGNYRPRMIALSAAMWSNPLTGAEVAATYNGNGGGSFDLEFNQAAYTSAGTLEHWWRFGHQGVPNMFVDYADGGTNPQTLDSTNIGAPQIQAFDAPPGGSAILVTLPDSATNNGRSVTIQDQAGNASGVAIVVLPAGSDNIGGNATDEIDTAFGSKTYVSDGAGGWRVGSSNVGGAATDVSYDNTASGLTGETVQDAIDDLALGGGGAGEAGPTGATGTFDTTAVQTTMGDDGNSTTTLEVNSNTESRVVLADNSVDQWRIDNNGGLFRVTDVVNSETPIRIQPGAGNDAIFIDSDGDVGIGDLPDAATKLHVKGNSAKFEAESGAFNLIVEGATGQAADLRFRQAGSDEWIWRVDGAGNFVLKDSANNNIIGVINGVTSEAIRIDSQGEVGINDTTPNRQLDVGGTGRFSALLEADGGLDINGARVNSLGVTSTGTNLTVTDEDLVACTAGSITITLPAVASAGVGRSITIKDRDGNANAGNITIDGNASETIDGATTFVMNVDYQSITVVNDGSTWMIV